MAIRALTWALLPVLSTLWVGTAIGADTPGTVNTNACPDYASYSQHPQ